MRCFSRLRNILATSALAATCFLSGASPASAVEMFTYFGDGSQIGLPSLEVPIEAYPGIPLRSDRMRARRAGQPAPRGAVGQFRGRGITIRVPVQPSPVPTQAEPSMPEPVPAAAPTPAAVEATPKQPEALRGANLDFGGLRSLSAHEATLQR
jgi:cell division septation protein DedD